VRAPLLTPVPQATVAEFKKAFHAEKRKYYPSRQRFTLPPKQGEARGQALEEGKRVSDYNLAEGSVLQFKDLGPQVRARIVRLAEGTNKRTDELTGCA
jgi:very-long-chain enoyl-CoA reductase